MVDIIFVELDAAFGALDGAHLAAKTFDLSIAGDARLDPVAPRIAADCLVIETVADHHLGPMRPRADEGHAPLEHVEELRQLVDAEPAKEPADRRYPRI